MKEIFLINAYTETTDKLDKLRNLITNVKNNGFEVCLVSHTSTPQDIIDRCDYYIYDKENPMITNPEVQYWTFYNTSEYNIKWVNKSSRTHALAYYRLIFGGLSYLKSLGYNIVHSFEYDIIISSFDEIKNNETLIDEYDIILYYRETLVNKITSFFTVNLNKINFSNLIYDKIRLEELYKNYYLNEKWPLIETILFDEFLPKNIYHKPISDLDNIMVLNTCNEWSHKFSLCLFPYEDKLYLFVLSDYDDKLKSINVVYNNNCLTFGPSHSEYYYIDEISNIQDIKVYVNDVLHFEHNLPTELEYISRFVTFTKHN